MLTNMAVQSDRYFDLFSGEGQSPRGSSTNESNLFSRRKHFHHWIQPHERAPASPVEKCMSTWRISFNPSHSDTSQKCCYLELLKWGWTFIEPYLLQLPAHDICLICCLHQLLLCGKHAHSLFASFSELFVSLTSQLQQGAVNTKREEKSFLNIVRMWFIPLHCCLYVRVWHALNTVSTHADNQQ